mmetsp:Transcript_23631/g.43918  ORF Transcript_23631/g.43918 Transcript_23631/m.43918 type:complete len:189 (+) Transcript_23631:119-685(+)
MQFSCRASFYLLGIYLFTFAVSIAAFQVPQRTTTAPFAGSRQPRLMAAASSSSSSKACDNKNNSNNKKKRGLYSFSEARKIARGHGFSTVEEFQEYDCPGAYQLPKNPHEVWAEDWKGWDDFLGICLSFEEGRKVARGLKNVETEEAYLKLFKEKQLSDNDVASRLPYRPDLKYKDQWISWDDFLLET